jgi:zinc D-Ala-D-Ala dipeptidase
MNKIMQGFQITATCLLLFLSTAAKCSTMQDTVLNKYGLWVIGDAATLQKTVRSNPAKEMVDLQKAVPGIVLDLRYASTSNFMHQQLYTGAHTTYMRKPAATALAWG